MTTFIIQPDKRTHSIERLTSWLYECLPGKPLRVTVEPYRKRRSDEQNRYLWGVCYPTILREGGEALAGWTANDLHQLFLYNHFGGEELEWGRRTTFRPLRTSSKLSTIEFSEFVASIQKFAAEQGVYIPDPEEQ